MISKGRRENGFYEVSDDGESFYGKQYWFEHQNDDYGFDTIVKRFRTDLSERTLFWLDKILKLRLPPAQTIELGCGPGSLIFVMQTLGFRASGVELSKTITDLVSATFKVPMMVGKIEDLKLESHAYDIVIIMDVLEHFTDPLSSLEKIFQILTENGILVIQTPRYGGQFFADLQSQEDNFLLQLKENEHLYLFTEEGLAEILKKVGLCYVQREDAFFPYDMFVFASKKPLKKIEALCIEEYLSNTPERRLIQGMLDLFHKWQLALKNAEARGLQVDTLTQWLKESEADRAARLKDINLLNMLLKESETDRTERLKAINNLEDWLKESEADRAARLDRIKYLEQRLEEETNKMRIQEKASLFKRIVSKVIK